MIVVIARFSVKPGKKEELLAAARELVTATRNEEGCISYSLLEDPLAENSFAFVEEWVDKAALQNHFTTPHIAAWRKQSADLRDGQTALTLYQADVTKL